MGELARGSAEAARLLPFQSLVLVLLLLGITGHAGAASSACDTVNCGKGNCTPGLLPPGFECRCDTGWSHALEPLLFSPCIIPNCTFDSTCLKLNHSWTPKPGVPLPGVCDIVSCGAGGECKTDGAPFSYSCKCLPGYANLLNLTTLPCVNCFLGDACYALGLGPPPPAKVPAPAPPPPSGDHDPSGPSAPPSGTKGSVSSPSLVQQLLLLLLVSVATVHVV